ncbi:MAG TPA: hypothetical protein VFF50_10470 [Candidatus Deferrimicrobiaceae bacterium]|jgi:hypothetical protein|nr:hypothetical protein [Candidatus Deferrimicrobiaceae bacterium]
MQKIGLISFVMFLLVGLANAQIPTSGNLFFGYSYLHSDLSSGGNLNGWEASIEGKIIPFLGIVADFDGHYGSQSFSACANVPVGIVCSSFNPGVTEHNYLFGPRASLSLGKFRPFAEALVGVGHVNAGLAGSDTSFATGIGGGLDYKIIKLIAWRIQGDYVQTRFFSGTQNNARFSTGIVVHF